MTGFLSESSFFAAALTLLLWRLASLMQEKTRSPFLNPILLSAGGVIAVLLVLGIPNSAYQRGMQPFSYLMTPATVCLALPLYEQVRILGRNLPAIIAGVVCGVLTSLLCIGALCLLFRLEPAVAVSLLPKSVTTAIGVPLSEGRGGLGSVTAAAIIVTGIIGNTAGPLLCRIFGIRDPVAQGTAFGTASHVIGTAGAGKMGAVQGAVGSLSLVVAGVLTAVLFPAAAAFFL